MSNHDSNQPAADPSTAPEFNNPNFQHVLKALLAAYQPVLEEQLQLSQNVEELQKEAGNSPPDCASEFAAAERLFGKFLTEDVALQLIPEKNREELGPIESWRLCLRQIQCCIIFGWLVCRGPRTFRAWAVYVHRYWLCVRQALGVPVADPPTEEQRNDFNILIGALAKAYKPYLTDQLASVEFPAGIPEEILNGKIDCTEGENETHGIFERLLTSDAAQALLGKAAFAESRENFWLCRCWCICSLSFGCCLARSRTIIDVLWCLVFYFRCLGSCFQALTCELTAPTGCNQEQEFDSVSVFRGVQIFGTATGASCDHYTLEWRQDGIGPWLSSGIVYPGNAAIGPCGVTGGLLGYLTTYPLVTPGLVEIQLCVFSSAAGVEPCCTTIFFELQRNLVWIRGIEGLSAATPPGIFDPTAQIVDGSGVVRSFGTAVEVLGSADVGGCSGTTIKRLTLSYQQGFTTTTAGAWTQFWEVDYFTSLEVDAGTNLIFEDTLTKLWNEETWIHLVPLPTPHFVCNVVGNYLSDAGWSTQVPGGPFPVNYPDPAVTCGEAPVATWNATPLPVPNCQSGRFTLRLTVTDTGGGTTNSLRQVWFDNKQIYGEISQIGSVPICTTLELSEFAQFSGNQPDCNSAWPAPLQGIAYDEYILEGDTTAPSDNFGGYSVSILKAGGSFHGVPIPGPAGPGPWPPASPPLSFVGGNRVGDPGVRCLNAVPPPGPIPAKFDGILAMLDMRRLDAVCNTDPADADLVLKRGECCGFIIQLSVWDTTVCPSLSGGRHQIDYPVPFCICNDLPPVG